MRGNETVRSNDSKHPERAIDYFGGSRDNAEREVDVRAFHDELLGDGALPLNILEAKMDRWIEAQRSRP